MISPAAQVTPRYLNIDDAAVYLGTTRKALRKRIERRTIPYLKDGRRIKFDCRVLDFYMAQRSHVPLHAPDELLEP